jgi:hypothetical protein
MAKRAAVLNPANNSKTELRGRRRREYPDGTIVNTTKIVSRSNEKRGRPGDNEQYLYNGECLVCGAPKFGRIWDFRTHNRCRNCPREKNHKTPTVVRIFKDGKAFTN